MLREHDEKVRGRRTWGDAILLPLCLGGFALITWGAGAAFGLW